MTTRLDAILQLQALTDAQQAEIERLRSIVKLFTGTDPDRASGTYVKTDRRIVKAANCHAYIKTDGPVSDYLPDGPKRPRDVVEIPAALDSDFLIERIYQDRLERDIGKSEDPIQAINGRDRGMARIFIRRILETGYDKPITWKGRKYSPGEWLAMMFDGTAIGERFADALAIDVPDILKSEGLI